MGIDFSEFDAYYKRFQAMRRELDGFLKEFLLEMVLRTVGKAVDRTPVDTGALRAAWQIGGVFVADDSGSIKPLDPTELLGEVRGNGKEIVVEILNDMDYASFLEYGYQHVGGFWMDGHFMLTIALTEVESVIQQAFDLRFTEFMRKHGML